jgi:hypothetical protein
MLVANAEGVFCFFFSFLFLFLFLFLFQAALEEAKRRDLEMLVANADFRAALPSGKMVKKKKSFEVHEVHA